MSDEDGAGLVRTRAVRLLENEWTAVGQGPSLVAAYGADMLFAISDIEPALEDVAFMLCVEASPLPVATPAKLWARAVVGGGLYARAVVAPLTAGNPTPPADKRGAMRAITSAAHMKPPLANTVAALAALKDGERRQADVAAEGSGWTKRSRLAKGNSRINAAPHDSGST